MDRATYRQFVGAIEAEIRRRIRVEGNYYISRTEIEEISRVESAIALSTGRACEIIDYV